MTDFFLRWTDAPKREAGGSARSRGWVYGPWGLCVVVLLATLARTVLVNAGPDVDTDAYGHAMAGRRWLEEPWDLGVHWVWLPAIHAIHSAMTALGWGLQGVRYLNVVLSAAGPFLLAALLRQSCRGQPACGSQARDWVVVLAPVLMALEPISLFLGASGQPEPLFCLLVLGACLSWGRKRFLSAGLFLAVAAMTRYEAWILPPVFFFMGIARPRNRWALLTSALPLTTIMGWCTLQFWSTGEWLHFLRLNAEFANGYWSRQVDQLSLFELVSWYWVRVPVAHMFGWPFLFAAFSVPWWLRQGRLGRGMRALLWASLAVFAFISGGLVLKNHLGLDRHAAVLVPAYSVSVAAGLTHVVRWLDRILQRRGPNFPLWCACLGGGNAPYSPYWAGGLVGGVLLWILVFNTAPRLHYMVAEQGRAQASPAAAARVIRSLDPPRVYCDVAAVEVLSNLPPERFLRWRLNDLSNWQLERDWATYRSVIAASAPARLMRFRERGVELYRDESLLVLRLERTP